MVNDTKSVPYNISDYLQTPEDIAEYLNAAIEDGNERVLLLAIRDIVDATGGMTDLSRKTGLSRESLYKTLSENGNPRFSSLAEILKVLGLELAVKPGKQVA